MAWLSGLAGKAEDFLNKVDQSAATALHVEEKEPSTASTSATRSPYFNQSHVGLPRTAIPADLRAPNLSTSSSVPANLSRIGQMSGNGQHSQNPSALATKTSEAAPKSVAKNRDDELFEFLNSTDTTGSASTPAKKKSSLNMGGPVNGGHSRQSSASSVVSGKGTRTPDILDVKEQDEEDRTSEDQPYLVTSDDLLMNNDSSSGYHSNQEDGTTQQQQQLSSLELENRLLKNEVASLNQEMTTVIQRAKDAQIELSHLQQQRAGSEQQMRQRDQQLRQVQSEADDYEQALKAKDSQMAVLRVRFDEVDRQLQLKVQLLEEIQNDRERILQDHTSVSGVHSQTLESLKEKLADMEVALQKERETNSRIERDSMQWQERVELEKQNLSDALTKVQRKINEQTAHIRELENHISTSRAQADRLRQELQDYKDKATRILQSKDRLISSLKEGNSSTTPTSSGDEAIIAELDGIKQEREMLREEIQQRRLASDALTAQLQQLDLQMQQDGDSARDQLNSMEEQLGAEQQRREEAEGDVNRQKSELRYVHEELLKQKTALTSRIQDRDAEIERLRNQLTTKSLSSTSQVELESRLHMLTESLIQKQTMLESLGTEKNSLVLQLERMERQCRESEAAAVRATSTRVTLNDDDEVRQRLPGFMRVSPQDSRVAKRVKHAADSIDRFSIRLGVFLRRYPIARIFVITYMVMLHLWVMVVLLTYKPEIHNTIDANPKMP